MTISSDGQDGDYALLGRIILLWGNVEMELVNIILRLNHPMSQPKIKFKVPVPFDEKLKFAIMRYREIPEMVPLANQAQTVFATLPPLHKTRTQIVHGGFQGRRGDGSFLFNFYHSKASEPNRFGVFEFIEDELVATFRKIQGAKKEVESLSRATFLIPPP